MSPYSNWEDGRLGKRGHTANLEHTPQFELDCICGCIGKLTRIRMFIKYKDQPREELFIIGEIRICELRELVDD